MSKTEILGYLKALGVFLLFTAVAGVVAIIVGLITRPSTNNSADSQNNNASINYTQATRDEISIEEAQNFIGMSVKNVCSKYGKNNIHLYYGGEHIGAGGIDCEETASSNHFYDGFIIVQVYYNEDDGYEDIQKLCKNDNNYSFCGKPRTIYADSLPKNEAAQYGIQAK